MAPLISGLSKLTNVGVLLVDADGIIQFVSSTARDLLECEADESIHDCVKGIQTELNKLHQHWKCQSDNPCGEQSGEQSSVFDLEVEAEDGEHHLRLTSTPIDVESCSGTLIIIRDIRNEALMEKDLRMAATFRNLSRLYQSMAHDLRTPIATILLYTQLMENFLVQNQSIPKKELSDQRKYLGYIIEGTRTLEQSLSLVLEDLINPENTRIDSFDLRRTLDSVVKLTQAQSLHQKVSIAAYLPAEKILISGPGPRIKLALLNITTNALEAMPSGGSLAIKLNSDSGLAKISISDSGTGISPEIQPRVFEKYFTTKGAGTGIGLHVSREIVREYGGDIQLESSDQGTTFTITLPIQDANSA